MFRTVLAAALAAGTFAAPALATRDLPQIGACRFVPMQYPEVVDDVAEAVYDAAPPVRTAVYTVCGL